MLSKVILLLIVSNHLAVPWIFFSDIVDEMEKEGIKEPPDLSMDSIYQLHQETFECMSQVYSFFLF